ncbi:MAG TPA: hypothetical protein VIV83_07530 [Gemmatimonadales bacterium]|jgi:hypothetical protein
MNRARIEQLGGIPVSVRAWLRDAPADLWEQVGRWTAVRIGSWLLRQAARAAEDDRPLADALRVPVELARFSDPAFGAMVASLTKTRVWRPHTVAGPVCELLDLNGAADDVAARLRIWESPKIAQAATEK